MDPTAIIVTNPRHAVAGATRAAGAAPGPPVRGPTLGVSLAGRAGVVAS